MTTTSSSPQTTGTVIRYHFKCACGDTYYFRLLTTDRKDLYKIYLRHGNENPGTHWCIIDAETSTKALVSCTLGWMRATWSEDECGFVVGAKVHTW